MAETVASPLDGLRADHQVVLGRLAEFERQWSGGAGETMEGVRTISADLLSFLEAEVWHHFRKEETALFPVIDRFFPRENAPVDGGPVFVLTEEHSVLKRLVARYGDLLSAWNGQPGAELEQVRLVGSQLVRAFQKHIYKEDNIVFRLTESLLPAPEQEALARALTSVD